MKPKITIQYERAPFTNDTFASVWLNGCVVYVSNQYPTRADARVDAQQWCASVSQAFAKPDMTTVKFRKMHPSAVLPEYQTAGAAGMDLVWDGRLTWPEGAFNCLARLELLPADPVARLHTGLEIELEPGFEAQIRPRSSMGCRGLIISNAPGTIDSDYRGEVIIQVHALERVLLERGDRIAQLVIAPAPQATIVEVDELSPSARGAGGFGSTGR